MTHISSRYLVLFTLLVVLFCAVFLPTQSFAQVSTPSFDSSDVLSDLTSSTVDNKPFDINKYPYNEQGSVQIVNFVEYCYSFKTNMRAKYGLYVYVYNPKGVNLSTDSKQNKIQMMVGNKYEKYNLEFCSKSEDARYKNLFYKYKVKNASIFLDRLNTNERRYDISGVELLTYGSNNATEYGVGGKYKFTGYSEGYGADSMSKSSLACIVENLETLELQVHHSNFRTNVSSQGKDHYNEVNSVYFSVPERIFDTYGYLQKIRAEWWEYTTKMAAVTSNKDYYNTLMQHTKTDVGEYSASVPNYLYSGYSGQASTQIGVPTLHNYDWSYNVDLSTKYSKIGTISEISTCKRPQSMMPFAFYSPKVDLDSVFDFLYSDPIAGAVQSTQVAEWIYSYKNNLGHGNIDCNGRAISQDLFEKTVDSGRTMGHNDKTIDLSDTFDLDSYDTNHSWWDKLWDYGLSWPQTSGDYAEISPIYQVQAKDIVGSNAAISSNLLINEDSVSPLRAFYLAEKLKGNRVVLFRFANTDYYSAPAYTPHTANIRDTDTYVAKQTVFLDFDIIELTFNKAGEYHVIPVVSSPTDIINGITEPDVQLDWWKVLLGIVLLIVLIAILFPLLPWLITLAIKILLLPFKLIKALFTRKRT